MIQPVASPPQYIPIQQDTFINTSASIPEPMKPFDGLEHSYTPEEHLQQVEARLTFAVCEEPHNNHIKFRSWHNRRMAFIKCSLFGTALDWYTYLHISYKQQWNSFVQLFKKQFSSQKTAHYAQVEAMSLMEKDNETVRHFVLRVQQLVKKGWCIESASTINPKNNEIFTNGLPKKLKDLAHRRQVKHVSTLLEQSIPFHTLVRHVDSEDIANEKIGTNDPRLITETNFHDDNRPYRYEQNIQEQQNLFINNDNNNKEDDNNKEEYILENQYENCNEDIVLLTNENNTSEYTTPESTLAQNASQTEKNQQPLNSSEFQLESLAQDKIHMTHNHNKKRLHIVISPFIIQLTQMK